ncbi:MAG TPA: HAMP domain-containing protein [Rhodospirillales bacterium]|nr:HAMP domain-containing protein [Rhodospirillales bacterium]
MIRLIPNSIVGRTVLVLLVGLTLTHLIGLYIYSSDRHSTAAEANGRRVAERIAVVTRLIDRAGPERRAELARSQWGPAFKVSVTPASEAEGSPGNWRTRMVRSILENYLGKKKADKALITYKEEAPAASPQRAMAGHMMRMSENWPGMMGSSAMARMAQTWNSGQVLEVSLPLDDGRWLNFSAPFMHLKPFWASRLFFSLILMTATVFAFSVWAVRRSTAPLAMFAKAAERFGMDVDAPPLPGDGPREVRRAVSAFNRMQKRLKSFVEDRTEMIAAISHDLRTPITRLKLRAEFMEDDEQRAKMLNDLDEMEVMISEILAFSRDASAQEPSRIFDLAALLESICDDASDAGRDVTYDGPAKLCFTGRAVALGRVFGNLVENAVKYGGRAKVSLRATGDGVEVRVEDGGPGIPEEHMKTVFQPFRRLETSRSRETGGVGLGLSVARSIARAHGGEITLSNRERGGLLANVRLPVLDKTS